MLKAHARCANAVALAALGFVGYLIAAQPRDAAADGLLPTTVAIPTLPVTLPTVSVPTLPSTTGTTTTTPTTPTTTSPTPSTKSVTTSAGASPGATAEVGSATGGATAATAGVAAAAAEKATAGALRLPGGSISIPVTSVVAPNRLVLAVALAPRVTGLGRPVTARVQVRDRYGRFVRGATVAIRSMPGGLLRPVAQKRSAPDGRASLVVHGKQAALRANSRLWLLVTALDTARPKLASVSRLVAVPIHAPAHSNE
jgi:hypothetical protein